ncbi:MAG: hypothetical protein K9H84_01775 [Bacteroidales bacterium]|nr:hypothetical protein [Bacteroidales bacterium]
MHKHLFLGFILLLSIGVNAQESQDNNDIKLTDIIEQTKISGQWFLSYEYDISKDINKFKLKRGYFTFKTRLNDMFSLRYTQDITLDQVGEDAGNVEMRLKYLYIAMKPFKTGCLKHSSVEFGLIHRPWLDYEQSINPYRVQGKMFAEHNHLLNSADFGLAFSGLIGGKIDQEYQKNIDKKYPGKYGSYSFGIYNGPGYHAAEVNNNKTAEGRLSLRPLPDFMPGLQFTYAFVYGKANIPDNKADFNMNIFFISKQTKHFTLTGQYLTGTGNSSGSLYIPAEKKSMKNRGFSFFGEIKIPKTQFALFGRYDNFENYYRTSLSNISQDTESIIGGIAYRFLKNKLVLDYNQYLHQDGTKKEQVEIAIEVRF